MVETNPVMTMPVRSIGRDEQALQWVQSLGGKVLFLCAASMKVKLRMDSVPLLLVHWFQIMQYWQVVQSLSRKVFGYAPQDKLRMDSLLLIQYCFWLGSNSKAGLQGVQSLGSKVL